MTAEQRDIDWRVPIRPHRSSVALALRDVIEERKRQDDKWGEQNHQDGTEASPRRIARADAAGAICDKAFAIPGAAAWEYILMEEVFEAAACAPNSPELRKELIQVAAVALAWVEAMDRRPKP